MEIKFLWISLGSLIMKFYCIRLYVRMYNISSAWFLDIRVSTCWTVIHRFEIIIQSHGTHLQYVPEALDRSCNRFCGVYIEGVSYPWSDLNLIFAVILNTILMNEHGSSWPYSNWKQHHHEPEDLSSAHNTGTIWSFQIHIRATKQIKHWCSRNQCMNCSMYDVCAGCGWLMYI